MICLGVDTSTFAIGLGIVNDDETMYKIYTNKGRPSANRIHTMIQGALKEIGLGLDDIGVFACAIGPGSFTGLRVGLATIQGLTFSLSRPLYGIPTFGALVWKFLNLFDQIVPLLDARRNTVYTAVYKKKKLVLSPRKIGIKNLLEIIDGETLFIGDGARVYRELILKKLDKKARFLIPNIDSPGGDEIAYQGLLSYRRGKSPDEILEPIYLEPVIIRKKQR